jgi:hypothetical protein
LALNFIDHFASDIKQEGMSSLCCTTHAEGGTKTFYARSQFEVPMQFNKMFQRLIFRPPQENFTQKTFGEKYSACSMINSRRHQAKEVGQAK